MSKSIITADIHAGVPGKHQDVMWALNTMSAYAEANSITAIQVLGDLVHDRYTIDFQTLTDLHAFFKKEKACGRTWIIFPGNHDMYMRHSWNVTSLMSFENTVTYIDTVKAVDIDDARWWVLPFIQLESAYMRVLDAVSQKASNDDYLMTHIGVNNAIKNICFLLTEWNIVHFHHTPFKRVYTGHFHCYQAIENKVWYPGSPIPLKSDEGDCDHGFLVFDHETGEHEFINTWKAATKFEVSTPDSGIPAQYWTIAVDDLDSVDQAMIDHNIVRVAVEREYAESERHTIEKRLKGRGAKQVRWLNLNVENDVTIKPNKNEAIKGLFSRYLNSDDKGTYGLNTDLLLRLHAEVEIEADDRYFLNVTDEISGGSD